ncbi:MAG: serine/threonine-protein kinase [Rhodospirillaceae bacterium]
MAICPNCFAVNVTAAICPECGHSIAPPGNDLVLAAGSTLADRYMVGRVLGQGGFGATYLGQDVKLSTRVAIKEYLPFGCVSRGPDHKSLQVNPSTAESYQFGLTRFLDEARVLARFRSCRNIVSVFDFFEENGSAYIVMEFLTGSTLKFLMTRCDKGRMPLARALPILDAVLNALADIHAQNILHRDISPDNVIVTDTGEVRILDFGAARHALSSHSQKMSVILKPGYAPFEQYLETGNQGPWSDVYAAAATFYHLVTGTKPVDALARMSGEPLLKPSELQTPLPPGLEPALIKALALKVDDRYRAASDFRTEITKAMRAAAPPPPPPPPAAAAPAKPAKPAAKAAYREPPPGQAADSVAAVLDQLTRTAFGLPPVPQPVPDSNSQFDAALQAATAAPSGDGDMFDGKPINTIELSKLLQEHARYLKGQKQGRRLDLSFRRLSGLVLTNLNFQDSELRGSLWRNCTLNGSNLRGANLFCADFTGAKLVGCNFQKADLRGTRFDGANLSEASFDGSDCRDGVMFVASRGGGLLDVHKERDARAASFNGANLMRTSFCSADLAGADFRKARAEETRFDKANLADANFAQAKVIRAEFDGANLAGAEFTQADLQDIDTSKPEFAKARIVRHLEDIEEDLRIKIIDHKRWVETLSREGKRLVIKDCNLSGLQMQDVNWAAAEFHNVEFHDVVLRGAKLSMATFRNCRMTNADLSHVEGCGTNFSGSSLVGANLSGGDFTIVTSINNSKTKWRTNFEGSDLSGAVFIGAKLSDVRFAKAKLADADFTGADLTNADFKGADVTGADLTNAKGAVIDGAVRK